MSPQSESKMFADGEAYGNFGQVDDLLRSLADAGLLYLASQQYHWLGQGVPAHDFSLRTSTDETVIIQDIEGQSPQVIGEIDLDSVPVMAYEGAIYMHLARAYLVESLDCVFGLCVVYIVGYFHHSASNLAEIRLKSFS